MKITKASLRAHLNRAYSRNVEASKQIADLAREIAKLEKLAEEHRVARVHVEQMYRVVCRANGQLANAVVNQAEALERTK